MSVFVDSVARRLRHAIKRTLAQTLYFTGGVHLWKRYAMNNRVVVLTYHRVLSDDDCGRTWSHPAIVVRRDTFERHIRILRREFQVLSLTEFHAYLDGKLELRRPGCLVTFDDGWRDTHTVAWPILKQHSFPVLVFISVGLIGTRAVLWQEHLRAVLYQTYREAQKDAVFANAARALLAEHGFGALLDVSETHVRRDIIDAVLARKYVDIGQALVSIQDLEQLLAGRQNIREGPDQFMSWSMVKAMAGEGAAFGGHGVTHRLLTTLDEEAVTQEVVGSRDLIHSSLGTHPQSFAYPDGKWNATVARALRRAGFVLGFSTEGGQVSPGDPPYAVRRLNIHEAGTSDSAMFLARLVGLL